MDNKAVGLQWQRRREDAGLGQDEAATDLDISRVTLSRYETGARPIPAKVAERMASLYSKGSTVSRESDPVTELVRRGQAEQAAWVLEFAAQLLEAGAKRLRQGMHDQAVTKEIAKIDAASLGTTPNARAYGQPAKTKKRSTG